MRLRSLFTVLFGVLAAATAVSLILVMDATLRRAAEDRVTLIGTDGRVANDTDLPPAEVSRMENHSDRPEVIEARRKGRGESRRFSSTEAEDRFYFARLLPGGDVLRLSVAAARVREIE